MRKIVHKIAHSPTLMTWGSFALRSISMVVVLPLLLTRLDTNEISLWYLFLSIAGLQSLMDVGFSPTFSRVIAYAMGGADVSQLQRPLAKGGGANKETLKKIIVSMRFVYVRIAVAWFCFITIIGTFFVIRPVSLMEDPTEAWVAWTIMVVCSYMIMWGSVYSAYLQGINQVALLRRWEMAFAAGGMVSSVVVLLAGGGLLSLVLVSQAWQVASVVRNRMLVKTIEGAQRIQVREDSRDSRVMAAVWPSAWRSGVGILMSYGLIQVSGIFYAQVATASQAAMYFLALRLIQVVSQFSQAPFYSKLPIMARHYAVGKRQELLKMASRGMALAFWSFAAGFLGLGLLADSVLSVIGSNVAFPPQLLWSILGLALYAERYGAMHIQLYSLTNRIVWHKANGIMGIILIICVLVSFDSFGVYAFPIGILVGYAGFYAWYSALHSYREFGMRFVGYEAATSFPPLVCMLLYILLGWSSE